MTECPVCANVIEFDEDTIEGELIECFDCGTELEVVGVYPPELEPAPESEEDWGQ